MKNNLDLTILEILELEPVSVRLRNALLRAASEDQLPFERLSEYLQNKNDSTQRLLRVPNLGKKSISELTSILDKYTEDPSTSKPSSLTSSKHITSVTIPPPYKDISLATFIRSCQCSTRLQNALIGAIERKEFGSERLGDLEGKSTYSLSSELREVPNLGKKCVEEFLELLNDLSIGSSAGLFFSGTSQASLFFQDSEHNLKSNFISLLEDEEFTKITVTEIINTTPALSKKEKLLQKKINTSYQTTSLRDLLASNNNDVLVVSRRILTDVKMVPTLAALLTDFYRFLLSKKNTTFLHDEYFSHHFLRLEEREIKVLIARLGGEGQTLEDIGKCFGVSRERVRQIESKALTKYVKSNRTGLFHLSQSLERYVRASKGVLSIHVIQRLYRVSIQQLEVVLKFIIPDNRGVRVVRDGNFILSNDFKGRKDQVFGEIEEFIYNHIGSTSKTIIDKLEAVNRPILEYFISCNNKKFSINADGDVKIVVSSASERARIVLTAAGQPLHTSEAVRLYKSIFGEDVTEHALGSTMNRLTDVLIVGPGKFSLYSYLTLNSEDIDRIREEAYRFICHEGRYLSSRIIFEHLCRMQPGLIKKEPTFNYYMVHGILQDDGRYRIRRGFMVGLPSYEDYLPLETEVAEVVEVHGPVTITEIMELLRPTRGELTNGSVRNSLVACEDVYLSAHNRKWDIADRVFNDPSDIRRLKTAIRIATYKEPVALSSVYNRVRSTGIEYALGTILSIIWKDPDITLERNHACFDGADAEIERYYQTGEPTTLWNLDYRNHTEDKSVDTDLLDALVKEFELYV